MPESTSKVTIHMAASLDGYVAALDGDFSWLDSEDKYPEGVELTEQDIQNFLNGIDCYLIGSKTYELALKLGWPYGDKPVIVLTQRPLKSEHQTVTFTSGELTDIINNQLKPIYTNIWIGGGPTLTKDLLEKQLADELIVSVVPVLLGNGTTFFKTSPGLQTLHLKNTKAYTNGMVELTYQIIKSTD